MARRKGIRKSQDNNVPGMPGATPFRPTNGGGPGKRDPRSAGQDGAGGMVYAGGTPGFYDKGGPGAPGKVYEGGELPQVGYPGGQHNPGSGQARPQDMNGGRKSRPQKGEPGMVYAGGTPGFYDAGGPGHGYQPFPGGNNGAGDNLPGFGGQFPGGGENTIGIPRGEVGTPFDGNMPPQSPGARRQRPTNGPEGFPAPGPGIPREVGGGQNTIGIPENYGSRPGPGKRPPRGGRPQRPPGRGMPSGGPGLSRPQFPGMNIPGAPGTNIRKTHGNDPMNSIY